MFFCLKTQSFVGHVYLPKERNPSVPWARKLVIVTYYCVTVIKISVIKNLRGWINFLAHGFIGISPSWCVGYGRINYHHDIQETKKKEYQKEPGHNTDPKDRPTPWWLLSRPHLLSFTTPQECCQGASSFTRTAPLPCGVVSGSTITETPRHGLY